MLYSGSVPPDEYSKFGESEDGLWHFYRKDEKDGFLPIKVFLTKGRSQKANFWITFGMKTKTFIYRGDVLTMMDHNVGLLKELCFAIGVDYGASVSTYDPLRRKATPEKKVPQKAGKRHYRK